MSLIRRTYIQRGRVGKGISSRTRWTVCIVLYVTNLFKQYESRIVSVFRDKNRTDIDIREITFHIFP